MAALIAPRKKHAKHSTLAATLLLFILPVSCTKTSEKQTSSPQKKTTFPQLSMAASMGFQYAVYILPRAGGTPDLTVALHQAMHRYPDLKEVADIPKGPQGMVVHASVQNDVKHKYAPPDLKSLQYFGRGLSRDQAEALQNAKQAFILNFAHPRTQVWSALRNATEVVEDIARKTGGLVWDEETREAFSPDAWHEKRLSTWPAGIPDVSSETVIHAYNTGESVRAITLGMAKIGLPDVVIESSGWSSNDQVGNLINLFCQSIAEGKPFRESGDFKLVLKEVKNDRMRDRQLKSLKAGATGAACITLRPGKWEEGDPKNRLIQLASDEYPGQDESAKQDAMVSSFFGSTESIAKVHHTQELLAASEKAKAKLPNLQKVFAAGLEPGEFIELKAPFETPDGGNEWMWVEVSSWNSDKIEGLLENEPENVPNMHSGQKVTIRQEDVFDYIHQFPDKRQEGNSTGDIIRKLDETGSDTDLPVASVVPACSVD